MFAGQMGCEALNFLLKRLIKEERPKRTSNAAFPSRAPCCDTRYESTSKLHQLRARNRY